MSNTVRKCHAKRVRLTDWQLAEWQRRVGLVTALLFLKRHGLSMNRAAIRLRESIANLSRYLHLSEKSVEALIPRITSGRNGGKSPDPLSQSVKDAPGSACPAGVRREIKKELKRAQRLVEGLEKANQLSHTA